MQFPWSSVLKCFPCKYGTVCVWVCMRGSGWHKKNLSKSIKIKIQATFFLWLSATSADKNVSILLDIAKYWKLESGDDDITFNSPQILFFCRLKVIKTFSFLLSEFGGKFKSPAHGYFLSNAAHWKKVHAFGVIDHLRKFRRKCRYLHKIKQTNFFKCTHHNGPLTL